MKKTRLFVVDDHKLFREMWLAFFATNENIEICGESGEFEEAIQMIKASKPDLVFLDINLSAATGFDAVPLITKFSPGTKVLAVSMHNQPAYAKKMLRLGAKAYITKNSSTQEILTAIACVMKGEKYICTEIKDILSDQVLNNELSLPEVKDLSVREIEVIKLIKDGLSSKEIADRLAISVRTAEVHRHNILKKLKLKNSTALINFIQSTDL